MIDLQACYNRQLVQIESIVQELVGVEGKLMKILTKILAITEYYISTSFRASNKYYSRYRERQVSIR